MLLYKEYMNKMSVLFLRRQSGKRHSLKTTPPLFRGNLSKNSLNLSHISSDDETHTSLRGKEEARSLRFCSFSSDDASFIREKKEYTTTR